MPRTSVDVRCRHVSHSLAISCKALHVCRRSTPSWRRGCTLWGVLPLHLRRCTHENQYKHTHESNKKNGNAWVWELVHIHWCVHNWKEFGVQKVRNQCRDKHLHIARTVSVSTACTTRCRSTTFQRNVQRSAADLDQASLGSQACEERERERGGGGGGGKRLGPLCLANSSSFFSSAPVVWRQYTFSFWLASL